MSLPNRLLDIMLLMKPVAEISAVKHIVPHVLLVAVLAFLSTLVGISLLFGLFYALYLLLLTNDFTPLGALGCTLGAGFMFLLMILIGLSIALRRLKQATPSPKGIAGILDSFVEGVRMSKKTPYRRSR